MVFATENTISAVDESWTILPLSFAKVLIFNSNQVLRSCQNEIQTFVDIRRFWGSGMSRGLTIPGPMGAQPSKPFPNDLTLHQ